MLPHSTFSRLRAQRSRVPPSQYSVMRQQCLWEQMTSSSLMTLGWSRAWRMSTSVVSRQALAMAISCSRTALMANQPGVSSRTPLQTLLLKPLPMQSSSLNEQRPMRLCRGRSWGEGRSWSEQSVEQVSGLGFGRLERGEMSSLLRRSIILILKLSTITIISSQSGFIFKNRSYFIPWTKNKVCGTVMGQISISELYSYFLQRYLGCPNCMAKLLDQMASMSTSLASRPMSLSSSLSSIGCLLFLGVASATWRLSSRRSRSGRAWAVRLRAVSMALVSQNISGGLIMTSSGFLMVGSQTVKWFSYCPSSADLFSELRSSSNSPSRSASTPTGRLVWFISQSTLADSDLLEQSWVFLPFSRRMKVKLSASCRQRRAVTASPLQAALLTLLLSMSAAQTRMRRTRLSMYLTLLMRMLPSANSRNSRNSAPIITSELIRSDREIDRYSSPSTRYAFTVPAYTIGLNRFFLLIASFGFISTSRFRMNSRAESTKHAARYTTPKTSPPMSAPPSWLSLVVMPSPQTIRNPLIIIHPQSRSNSTNRLILAEMKQVCRLLRMVMSAKPRRGKVKQMQPMLKTENRFCWVPNCRFMPKMQRRFLRGTKSREQSCCPSTPTHAIATNRNSSNTPLKDRTSTNTTTMIDPAHSSPISTQTRYVSTLQAVSSNAEQGFSSRLFVASSATLAVWLMMEKEMVSAASLTSCRMLILMVIALEAESKLQESRVSCDCRFKRDGTMEGGGVGEKARVAVIWLEEVSLRRLLELMEYPLEARQTLAELLELVQVKPASTVQVLEQPSPLRVLPSSHWQVLVSSLPSPQTSMQSVAEMLVYPLWQRHCPETSSRCLLVKQEVQLEAVSWQEAHTAAQVRGVEMHVALVPLSSQVEAQGHLRFWESWMRWVVESQEVQLSGVAWQVRQRYSQATQEGLLVWLSKVRVAQSQVLVLERERPLGQVRQWVEVLEQVAQLQWHCEQAGQPWWKNPATQSQVLEALLRVRLVLGGQAVQAVPTPPQVRQVVSHLAQKRQVLFSPQVQVSEVEQLSQQRCSSQAQQSLLLLMHCLSRHWMISARMREQELVVLQRSEGSRQKLTARLAGTRIAVIPEIRLQQSEEGVEKLVLNEIPLFSSYKYPLSRKLTNPVSQEKRSTTTTYSSMREREELLLIWMAKVLGSASAPLAAAEYSEELASIAKEMMKGTTLALAYWEMLAVRVWLIEAVPLTSCEREREQQLRQVCRQALSMAMYMQQRKVKGMMAVAVQVVMNPEGVMESTVSLKSMAREVLSIIMLRMAMATLGAWLKVRLQVCGAVKLVELTSSSLSLWSPDLIWGMCAQLTA